MRLKRGVAAAFFFLLFSVSTSFAASIFTQNPDKTNIGVNDEVSFQTSLSINTNDGTQYYLRGIFYKVGASGSNYCGLTWNGNNWFSGPYTSNEGWKNFFPVTIQNASWSGNLKVKIDPSDSDCNESGNYLFKIQRFTSSGSGAIDDQNEIQFYVTIPTATPTPAPTSTPTPTSKPVNTPTPTIKIVNTPTPTSTLLNTARSITSRSDFPTPTISKTTSKKTTIRLTDGDSISPTGEVKGAQDEQPVEVKGSRSSIFSWTFFVLAGLGVVTIACGILLFREWRKQKELEI